MRSPGYRNNTRARAETRQAHLFDEIIEIADTPVLGEKRKVTENGVEVTESDMIEHRRLQIDARKWALGKMNPKKYGDKVGIDHSNTDGSLAGLFASISSAGRTINDDPDS